MATLDLDQVTNKIIPRENSNPPVLRGAKRESAVNDDPASSALALVSEAAATIRQREQQAAQAVTRAHNAANAVKEQLRAAAARAERAEAALRQAESEIAELSATTMQASKDIEMLHSCLAAREAELAAAEQRAALAERRGDEAEAAIKRIMSAIRTELPGITSGV